MLSQIVHALLLLPEASLRPLLHEFLSLLPQLDTLNKVLPVIQELENDEKSLEDEGGMCCFFPHLVEI